MLGAPFCPHFVSINGCETGRVCLMPIQTLWSLSCVSTSLLLLIYLLIVMHGPNWVNPSFLHMPSSRLLFPIQHHSPLPIHPYMHLYRGCNHVVHVLTMCSTFSSLISRSLFLSPLPFYDSFLAPPGCLSLLSPPHTHKHTHRHRLLHIILSYVIYFVIIFTALQWS